MKHLKLNQKKVSQSFIIDRYLNNEEYFSADNKRFFNINKTECFELGEFLGAIIEHQGEFIPGLTGRSHVVLKLASHDRRVVTVTSGYDGSKNGLDLYRDIRDFLKAGLGNYERDVISKLNSIKLSNDHKDTLEFIDFNGNGFRLSFGGYLKIINHI